MLTIEQLDAAAKEVADQLGANSPEFMERHNEIMGLIEKAREGLGEKNKGHAAAV